MSAVFYRKETLRDRVGTKPRIVETRCLASLAHPISYQLSVISYQLSVALINRKKNRTLI
ncbi:MAG: hypothetical protein VSS75_013825 [Candidatus Parabeggiatoa sp.]